MRRWKRFRSRFSAEADFTSRIPDSVSKTWAFTSPPRWRTRRSLLRRTLTSGPQIPMAAGITMNAARVSFHEMRSMAASATTNSKTAEISRDISRVTSIRSCSISVVSRLTIWPARIRPKKPRSSSTMWS